MNSEHIDLTKKSMEKIDLFTDFNTFLEITETITKLGYDPRTPINIHFFEWSDVNQERIFNDMDEFKKFLEDSDIELRSWEESQVTRLCHTNGAFIICKPETHNLIIDASKSAMQDSLERAIKYSYSPVYNHYPACGCYPRDYNDYDDWD